MPVVEGLDTLNEVTRDDVVKKPLVLVLGIDIHKIFFEICTLVCVVHFVLISEPILTTLIVLVGTLF
jgi:hypothetical protein